MSPMDDFFRSTTPGQPDGRKASAGWNKPQGRQIIPPAKRKPGRPRKYRELEEEQPRAGL